MYILSYVTLAFLISSGLVALELQIPAKVPIEINNCSSHVITISYSYSDGGRIFDTVAPQTSASSNINQVPYAIAKHSIFRIITLKGHFAIYYCDPIFFAKVRGKSVLFDCIPGESIFLAGLKKIFATIDGEGTVALKGEYGVNKERLS